MRTYSQIDEPTYLVLVWQSLTPCQACVVTVGIAVVVERKRNGESINVLKPVGFFYGLARILLKIRINGLSTVSVVRSATEHGTMQGTIGKRAKSAKIGTR